MTGLIAPLAHADTAWDGPFMALGLGLGRHSFDLDRLEASVNGRAWPIGDERADGVLIGLGYRAAMGGVVLGAEAELQGGSRDMALQAGCVLGQSCARAGLVGRVGPTYRLRASLGREIGPGVLLSGGLGLSLADVAISHAYAQSASAQAGSAVITSAVSPFAVDDLALGWHASFGVEHRVTARAALRLDLVLDRLWVENNSRVFILTSTASGSSTATAQISEAGNFRIDSATVRLSFVLRF